MAKFTVAVLVLVLPVSGARTVAAPPPAGWRFESARDEIAAEHWAEGEGPNVSLGLAGRGDANVDGRWVCRVPVTAGR
jgi:hypothetical protein